MTGELEKHLRSSLDLLAEAGISVVSRRELPYGVQLKLEKGGTVCSVNLYHSRKKGFSVVGSGGDEFLLQEAVDLLRNPSRKELLHHGIRTGTDEAGKGDYFGPLVAAAVCCGDETASRLLAMGAGDSKRLSAGTVRDLYEKITVMDGITYSVCVVSPREYNALFAGFRARGKNSLDIQAMAHGKALQGILQKTGEPGTVVIDRFCDMKRLKPWLPEEIQNAVLMVKAEDREPAVAAASIIARSVYLDQLGVISRRYDVTLKPGAGEQVDEMGRRLVASAGAGVLPETAKIHFSNTLRITRGLDRS